MLDLLWKTSTHRNQILPTILKQLELSVYFLSCEIISINCVGMHISIETSNDNGIYTNIKYNLIMPRDLISQKELWTHDICELLFSWSVSYDKSGRMGDKRITI